MGNATKGGAFRWHPLYEPGSSRAHGDWAEEAGFEAIEAANADEAIRILESRTDIRVVFTDINIHGSMDGLKLAHAVRARWPPIKLVVTSGQIVPAKTDLPEGGRFVPKPYSRHKIASIFRELVGLRGAMRTISGTWESVNSASTTSSRRTAVGTERPQPN